MASLAVVLLGEPLVGHQVNQPAFNVELRSSTSGQRSCASDEPYFGEELRLALTYVNRGASSLRIVANDMCVETVRVARSADDYEAGRFETSTTAEAPKLFRSGSPSPDRLVILQPGETLDVSGGASLVGHRRRAPALPVALSPGSHVLGIAGILPVLTGASRDAHYLRVESLPVEFRMPADPSLLETKGVALGSVTEPNVRWPDRGAAERLGPMR